MSDPSAPPPVPDGSAPSPGGPPPLPPTVPPPSAPSAPAAAPPPLAPAPVGPPVTDPSAVTDPALHHETEQTRTYPCVNCGAELVFHIGHQKLSCPACGHVQDIVETQGKAVQEQDFAAALASLRDESTHRAAQQLAGEKEVVCQNCGGHTTFTGTLTSTRCPYCATPIQREDVHDAPARLAVDGVLPFKIDDKAAKDSLDKWINKRWFAPSEFKKYNQKGSFTSVYAAYFTYDAETHTRYTGQRGDDYRVTVGSGNDRRTETRTDWKPVSGQVRDQFDDLTVLANDGFDRRYVFRLEPWPTGEAQPFSPEFIAGHLCRTYDHDVEHCFGEARDRIDDAVESTIRRDIGGDHQRISSKQIQFLSLTYKHLLLPIWLLTVIYEGKPFQVFMNGATGEVHGQRPWSKVKIAIAVVAALIVLAVIIAVVAASGGDTSSTGT